MNLTLERFAYSPMGTFGRLRLNHRTWYTVEKPWRHNQAHISCIPEGVYKATRYHSPTPGRGEVWQLNDVPGRSNIQIHIGNTERDVIGCISLGTELGCIVPKGEKLPVWGVRHSGIAMTEFWRETEVAQELIITVCAFNAQVQGEL